MCAHIALCSWGNFSRCPLQSLLTVCAKKYWRENFAIIISHIVAHLSTIHNSTACMVKLHAGSWMWTVEISMYKLNVGIWKPVWTTHNSWLKLTSASISCMMPVCLPSTAPLERRGTETWADCSNQPFCLLMNLQVSVIIVCSYRSCMDYPEWIEEEGK